MLHSLVTQASVTPMEGKAPSLRPAKESHQFVRTMGSNYAAGAASPANRSDSSGRASANAQSMYGNQAVLRTLNRSSTPTALQRKCACEGSITSCAEGSDKKETTLHRHAANSSKPNTIPPIVHDVLSSPGSPLDAGTRAFMEMRFGYDFSGVRVHTDSRAAESARAVDALAYTVGPEIVFAAGNYAPRTRAGGYLLAHELAHVVQQGDRSGHQMQNRLEIGATDDPAELEADHLAQAVIQRTTEAPPVQQQPAKLRRAVSTQCLPPSVLFTLMQIGDTSPISSAIGQVAENLIETNYCTVTSCALMVTDYFDNPIPGSYIAFLIAHNPALDTPVNRAALALLGLTGLNRPDILTDKPARKEFYEIKPKSVSGIAEGIEKLLTITAFMSVYSLPYILGTTYVPTPPLVASVTVMAGPWPLTVSLRAERIAPGLLVYDFCFTGELGNIALAALAVALVAALILLAPELSPVLAPIFAKAESTGNAEPNSQPAEAVA
jgi:hypothetical protein